MKKNLSKLALLLMVPIFLTSCASHKTEKLSSLTFDVAAPLENVYMSCKAFDKADSKRYLGKNVLSYGYQPLQISIRNNSKDTYFVPLNGISLPHQDHYKVAEEVHYSTATRAVVMTGAGYIGANLIIVPAGLLMGPFALIPAVATLIATPVIGGVKSSQANRAIDRDFERKGAQDSFIGPHSTLNMILFVPSDYFSKDFTVRMNNTTSGETFVVDMQCQ